MDSRVFLALLVIGCASAAESPAVWNNRGAERFAAHDYSGAERLYLQALEGWKTAPEPRDQARTMSNLAVLYRVQRRYGEAESTYREALELLERSGMAESAEAATTLNNLAELYRWRGEPARGEPYARRAVALAERMSPAGDPVAANSLHTLAAITRDRGRLEEALSLYARERERLGNTGAPVVSNLSNAAEIRIAQKRYADAEALARRAVDMAETSGAQPRKRALALNNLAQALRFERRYDEAEPLYAEALGLLDGTPESAEVLANFAGLQHDREREARAVEYYRRALNVMDGSVGPEHPEPALVRTRLADVRRAQGHYSESLDLYRQSLPLLERAYGPDDERVVAAARAFKRATAEAQRHTVAVR